MVTNPDKPAVESPAIFKNQFRMERISAKTIIVLSDKGEICRCLELTFEYDGLFTGRAFLTGSPADYLVISNKQVCGQIRSWANCNRHIKILAKIKN